MRKSLRQALLLLPCIWLLASHFGTGAVWMAFWPAELAGAAYAIFATLHELRSKDFFA